MRIKNIVLILTAILASSVLPSTGQANSGIDAAAIEATIRDLQEMESAGQIDSEQREILLSGLGTQIAMEPPNSFNDIIVHILADWRSSLNNREINESILSFATREIEKDLQDYQSRVRALDSQLTGTERSTLIAGEVFDQTMNAFVVVYSFQFGKGLWKSRGQGLARMELFRTSLRNASSSALKSKGLLLTSGTVAGLSQLTLREFESRRANPIELLRVLKKQRLSEIAEKAASIRIEIEQIPQQQEGTKALMGDALSLQKELIQLLETSPELKRASEPVQQDLLRSLKKSTTN